ncbi:nitrite reductase large subunit NirB [Marinoscillum furvescens]|uniref:Assimilatory nitrite reductase (NAD(P)H) large subunit n=1 Tax=Marinoscillum furvescens DSM 4134 TaxID=1122208 RepID=A0A3D9LGU6_MARFU|nr:nitrite reductase large subunit NirB [Marinoscillum furvescens]REE05601.1 assimilatory nitrite reductase (NAD(P)H) large subunit precursor [Marinoscillum furvescens DSM 4134]
MKKVIVIGNGMVGYKFCEKLRAKADASQISLIVYGEEPLPAYDRVHLSEYFTNQSEEDLYMAPRSWYDEHQVTLKTSQLVTTINRDQKTIQTHTGDTESYDYLILATGSRPMVPPIQGVDKKGVFVYRTIEDLEQIIAYAKTVKRGAVLGGGLLGLEAAKALMDLSLDTQVIEFAPRLMPRQLDQAGSDMLKSKIESLGIQILLNKNTSQIRGNGKLDGLDFADGTTLETDMLVISCGIISRDELAEKTGLETGKRGGFKVNEQLQTNDPNIFAIGEAASYNDMVYGLVAPGYDMADTVVEQLIGTGNKTFTGADMSTKLKLIGVDVASFGDALGDTPGSTPIAFEDKNTGTYKRINLSSDRKKLLGGILVGDSEAYGMLLQITQNGMALPPNPEDLILGARGGDSGTEMQLPDTAQICSCENVTKGDIVCAIKDKELTDLNEVRSCTKAGTGCGACSPMVADIFTDTLKAMGQTVRKTICAHFDYTRQELYSLIKVKNIKSYAELLSAYGSGDGCETCKPAVASLLASIWNEPILKQDTIQDTNDRFLANIQKGGSYSVVPRVPGGEITPDKLIAIGAVAKKYDLYTKITGGQRIDLFGARLNDLPKIWRELIDAGFESGHAYGKALRTVKSCVGSTWCRYGLHDSVGFAIEIENRYKGIRSPHKLKGGVSGCRRECAEAQGKDFGLIATEVGYNLYVCGNGGANPQHAQLLAGDIDEKTAIKYLDRFLMFYIRTAEPLNRTSVWLNKLEGGIDYLRDVVVNDSLGLGEELEKDMQALIAAYHCEWKEAISNPTMQAKFKHFANTDDHDPTQHFVPMREMKKPAEWGLVANETK